jgi:hypothetical protein
VTNIATTVARHQFSAALIERQATPYPDLSRDYGMDASHNYGFYINPAMQHALTTLDQGSNSVERMHTALTLLLNNPPGMYLLWVDHPVAVQSTVRHFTLNPYNPLESIRHWSVVRNSTKK